MWHRKFDSSIWNFWEVKNHNQKFVTQSTSFTKGKRKLKKDFGDGKGGSIEIRQNEAEIKKQTTTKTIQYKRVICIPL